MSAAYRVEWGVQFEEQAPSPLDAVALGTFTARDATVDAVVRRGDLRAGDEYLLPYRLWMPPSPRGSILLLHGVCDYAGAFDAICPYFAKQNYAVMAYDQRGFGQTVTRGKWAGSKRMARDIGEAASFLKRRAPGAPLFVVGESMGAALAIEAAAQHNLANVTGLVVVAPGALGCQVRRIAFGLVARALQALGARADFSIQRINGEGLSADAAIRLLADPLVLRRISPALIAGLLHLGIRAFDLAPRVNVATLTLLGTREDVSPARCVRRLQSRLPGDATFVEFKDGPHMLLHWRDRDQVLATIIEWVNARVHGIPHFEPMTASRVG